LGAEAYKVYVVRACVVTRSTTTTSKSSESVHVVVVLVVVTRSYLINKLAGDAPAA
jgi:hypothetical protein